MFQKYGTIGKEIDMKTSMVLRLGSAALSNRALTLRLLFSHGALSRTDIADSLEITTAAVTSIVGELLEEGLVVQQAAPENQNQVGRRRLPLAINYDWRYILAIDIHSYYVNIAVTNMRGRVLAEKSLTPAGDTPEALCGGIAAECLKLMEETQTPPEKVLGAGVTVIGPINQVDGIALHLFRLFDEPFPIRRYFEEAFPFPVAVENNVCAILLSELRFTDITEEAHNILMLKWGPGVGSAVAIHDHIYKGYNYQSPEIGHNRVSEKDGLRCNCGQIGCLEPTVSADAIVQFINEKIASYPAGGLAALANRIGPPSRKNLSQYLRSDSETLWDFMADRSYALASVTSNALHILSPDKLVLMGDLFELEAVTTLFEQQLYTINPRLQPGLCVRARASAGKKFIGAAAIVVEQVLLPRRDLRTPH